MCLYVIVFKSEFACFVKIDVCFFSCGCGGGVVLVVVVVVGVMWW